MDDLTPIDRPADLEVPETRSLDVEFSFEARAEEDDDKIIVEGYASVFNSLSVDLGGFREVIRPGAFTEVLASEPDVRFLVNHDPSTVLARTTNGTLELREDTNGVYVRADLAPTQLARDLRTLIQRRDVTGMSFLMHVAEERFSQDSTGQVIREVLRIDRLREVSAVGFPAYDASILVARNDEPNEIVVPGDFISRKHRIRTYALRARI